MITEQDKNFIRQSIDQAKLSVQQGGFPAGTILVHDGKVIDIAVSVGQSEHDAMSHSDIVVLLENRDKDLKGSTLYSTVKPCLMCLLAAEWRGVERIVFACEQEKLAYEYYATELSSAEVNTKLLKPIMLEHAEEFEGEVLEMVKNWESGINLNN